MVCTLAGILGLRRPDYTSRKPNTRPDPARPALHEYVCRMLGQDLVSPRVVSLLTYCNRLAIPPSDVGELLERVLVFCSLVESEWDKSSLRFGGVTQEPPQADCLGVAFERHPFGSKGVLAQDRFEHRTLNIEVKNRSTFGVGY